MPLAPIDLLDDQTLDAGARSGGARPHGVRVAVVSGPDRGRTLLLDQERREAVLGSGAGCDLVLTDRSVSRRHLSLRLAEDGVHATDLGSKNGTFHGAARLTTLVLGGPARLRLGPATEIDLFPEAPPTAAAYPGERYGALLGRSLAMRQLFALLDSVAATDAPVLLRGETGTGKEALARALHAASPRRDGPFVVVDCGALARDLAGSELFGHVRGAFTGAHDHRRGLIEAAHRGTLFLDEIGELPLDLQPHLLRVLENREIRAVGDSRSRQVDIRVVAATHRDLRQRAAAGQFREDLYFRLAVVEATVPPLRERIEDLPLLVEHFLQALGQPGFRISEGLMIRLMSYEWPGNVRELRNVVQRCVSLSDPQKGLPAAVDEAPPDPGPGEDEDTLRGDGQGQEMMRLPFKEAKAQLLEAFERDYLTQLLQRHQGNVSRAAQEAGIDRNHIHRLIKRYRLRAQ